MEDVWVYDIEDYPNLFMISFIPLDVDQKLVDAYIGADKANDKEAKKILLSAMRAKSFIIFKGYYDDRYEKDERWLLHDFLRVHKVLYGYNSYGYDSIMLDILQFFSKLFSERDACDKQGQHITSFLNDYSNRIVDYGKGFKYTLDFYKNYKRTFTDRDIQKILYLDKSFTGLKSVAINLRWYRIQELPIPANTIIRKDQIEDIRDYNFNDILITRALIRDQSSELEIRDIGSVEFEIDLRNLSRSSIGKALVTKYYSEITGIAKKDFINLKTNRYMLRVKDLIDPKISFKTKQFNNLFADVVNSIIRVTSDKEKAEWGFELLYNGTKYVMAKGGLHSKDNPSVHNIVGKENMIMRDADVTSYYPKGILNLRIAPKHLEAAVFLAIVDYVMTKRVQAKAEIAEAAKTDPVRSAMLKKKAEIYKIAINRMYGAFKDAYDYLYDPLCTYKTTVNLQLYLLILIESLEIEGIHVISANTDGIVCLFDKALEHKYKETCAYWEKAFQFELEYTDYEKYVRNNVNSYIAIKKGFYAELEKQSKDNPDVSSVRNSLEKKYVKLKGMFVDTPDFSKGFINPVVSTALARFYIYGTDVVTTFKEVLNKPNGIYDFCISQKIDKKFKAQYHTILEGRKHVVPLQQYNRFYVSSSNTGNILKYDSDKRRYISIIAKQNLRILNTYRDEEINDLKLSYYVEEANKLIYGTKKTQGISDLKLDFTFESEQPLLETNEYSLADLYNEDEEDDNAYFDSDDSAYKDDFIYDPNSDNLPF